MIDAEIQIRSSDLNITMIDNVRLGGALVDQPPNVFHISDYISMIESLGTISPL